MATAQMLMVVGALTLFSLISLSVNRVLLDNDRTVVGAQSGIAAVALAWGKVEELVATGYDSLSVGSAVESVTTNFDVYVCSTSVSYVNAANLDSAVAGPTSLKRVSVTVANGYALGAVSLHGIVGDY